MKISSLIAACIIASTATSGDYQTYDYHCEYLEDVIHVTYPEDSLEEWEDQVREEPEDHWSGDNSDNENSYQF